MQRRGFNLGFKCVPASDIKLEKMEEKGAEGIQVRWLIKKEDGAPNFAMRLFELKLNGYSPLHSHNWEHEVYILEGKCKVTCEQQQKRATAGYFVFIPPNAKHQFANAGKSTLKFICLVPNHK
jgi:quercetin dioxygenase-like cupin family protein